MEFLELVERLSVGLASKDLPFGIIPAANRRKLANGIHRLYPTYDTDVLERIASDHLELILCIIKGFKPRVASGHFCIKRTLYGTTS